MKTAEEILIEYASHAGIIDPIHTEDALRQLCEAIEREVIGEDFHTKLTGSDEEWWRIEGQNQLRAEQRAKLRAFCGMGEQPSAVDAEWIDQQIERSEES